MPQIRVLGGDPIVPFFRQPEPPPPPPPTPDDPLDAARIHHRLDVIVRALDDLPGQAQRFARWQARRDARLAREREEADEAANVPAGGTGFPAPVCFANHLSQEGRGTQAGEMAPASPPQFLAPTQWGRGGEPEGRDGEGVNWDELGVTPEALALCRRAKLPGRPPQSNINAQPAKPRRHHRLSPMRPGRPPGFRKRSTHEVHELLNELHGLAVWARDGP